MVNTVGNPPGGQGAPGPPGASGLTLGRMGSRRLLLIGSGVALLTGGAHASFLSLLLVPLGVLAAFVGLGLTLVAGLRWVGQGSAEARGRFLARLTWVCGLLAAVAGMRWGKESRFARLEQRFAPLIVAAERYRAETGEYPERAEALLGAHLERLPACDLDAEEGGAEAARYYYYRRHDGPFSLSCPTLAFGKYTYESDRGRWHGWD